MRSQRQVAANRRNARKSTGPKTPVGRTKSSLNALTHGLTAATQVLPHEEADQFAAFLDILRADLAPEGALQEASVGRIAGLIWRRRRAPAFEALVVGVAAEQNRRVAMARTTIVTRSSRGDECRMPLPEMDFADAVVDAFAGKETFDKIQRYERALGKELREEYEFLQKLKGNLNSRARFIEDN